MACELVFHLQSQRGSNPCSHLERVDRQVYSVLSIAILPGQKLGESTESATIHRIQSNGRTRDGQVGVLPTCPWGARSRIFSGNRVVRAGANRRSPSRPGWAELPGFLEPDLVSWVIRPSTNPFTPRRPLRSASLLEFP